MRGWLAVEVQVCVWIIGLSTTTGHGAPSHIIAGALAVIGLKTGVDLALRQSLKAS